METTNRVNMPFWWLPRECGQTSNPLKSNHECLMQSCQIFPLLWAQPPWTLIADYNISIDIHLPIFTQPNHVSFGNPAEISKYYWTFTALTFQIFMFAALTWHLNPSCHLLVGKPCDVSSKNASIQSSNILTTFSPYAVISLFTSRVAGKVFSTSYLTFQGT